LNFCSANSTVEDHILSTVFSFHFFDVAQVAIIPPKRFSMRDNDPTEGLALMVKRFKKTVKTVKKTALCTQNLAKNSL
jgi:hypothetical protein